MNGRTIRRSARFARFREFLANESAASLRHTLERSVQAQDALAANESRTEALSGRMSALFARTALDLAAYRALLDLERDALEDAAAAERAVRQAEDALRAAREDHLRADRLRRLAHERAACAVREARALHERREGDAMADLLTARKRHGER